MYKTIRSVYIEILTELVREEAPTLYMEDFIYYYNKSISEYMKRRYEGFERTQQLTDDLRFWKKRHVSTTLSVSTDNIGANEGYEYRHLLNCIVDIYTVYPDIDCDQDPDSTVSYKATRLTAAAKAGILDNAFLKAKYYRPYFDILNNVIVVSIGPSKLGVSFVSFSIEYLKQPESVTITEAQVAAEEDTSQVLEFTSDVGDEITKIAIALILERGQNQRLQSHTAVNISVADSSISGEAQSK